MTTGRIMLLAELSPDFDQNPKWMRFIMEGFQDQMRSLCYYGPIFIKISFFEDLVRGVSVSQQGGLPIKTGNLK